MTTLHETLRSNGQKPVVENMGSSLQLLPLIMNNIPQAVFWKDRNLVYLGCNQAFADDAGFSSPEDIIGKTDWDMPWKDQAELYRADDRLVMESGESKLDYEEPQTTPNGSTIWLSTSKIPVHENGQIVAVLGMYEDITSRKQSEQALLESEDRFRRFTEATNEGLVFHEQDKIVDINPAALTMFGLTENEEFIGRNLLEFVAPEYHQLILQKMQLETVLPYEVQCIRKDHTIFPVETSTRTYQDAGRIIRATSIRDITERKLADETIKNERQRFQTILETIRVPTIISRLSDGQVLYANEALAQVSQVDLKKFIGFKTGNFYAHPDDRKTVLESLRQHGHINDFEVQFQRTDGSQYWALLSSRLVDYEGERCVLSTYIDITERKQAEDALQQSEANLSSALHVAQMGYWEFDIATQLFTFNDQYYALHGTTAQEVGGYQMSVQRFAQEFVYPEDAASVGQATQQAIETTDPNFQVQIESRILRKNGEVRWVTVWFRVEKDTQGQTIKLHGVNQDITERKRLEKQIQTAFERRGRQVELSTQVSQSIASASSLEELYERVVTQVKEQFGYYHTQLLRYDEAQHAIVLVTGYGETGAKMLSAGHRLPMGEGLIGTAAATGETVLRSTLENDPNWHPNPLLPETKGEIAVPIKLENSILGVLDVQSNVASSLDADDQLLLEGLCGQIAIAIESTRLRQEMAERLKEINHLYRAMSHEGWQTYRETTNVPSSFMFDQAGLRPAEDISLADEFFATIPLTVPGGEVIGTLAVADDPQRPISPDDQAFLEQVSEQVALALESARLFEQTQEALIQTEELSRQNALILDTAGEGIFGLDEKGNHTFVNPAAAAMLGYSSEELIGGHSHSIWHHSHSDGSPYPDQECPIYTSLHEGKIQQGEEYFWRKDGVGFPVDFTSTPVQESGRTVGVVVTFRDITERKKAEEVVRLAQQRAQMILESVTIPMVITRLQDNHLTFVNLPALDVTHYQYEDVIDRPSPDFYYNLDDRKNFIAELQASGQVADMVVQLRQANGEPFWALLSARIFDYQGETSILSTFMDISDRMRAQEAIAKRATELAAVANVSTTASTLLDPDQLLQSVVDLTRDRFGLYHVHIYLADESWQTLLLAAGAGEIGRQMVADGWNISMDHQSSIVADAARSRTPVIANDVVHDKDSSFLSNRLLPDTRSEMAVPIIVGEKLLGVFDVQSDKTEYFTDEDANIYITLASQIGVALQNARLYVEQAATLTQLRELDKLKSSFLANMSHELRTPLNSILGFTDVMLEGLDGSLTDYMDNDLRLIQKNGQHLLHLINDVLDMAKIEAGRMNLNPETFKVHEVLHEVTGITSTLANEKKLSLFIEDRSDQNIEIYADRTRFRQVLINLVNNAIKFTDKGQVALHVAPVDGARVLITVKDTGIGIPSDNLEMIFQEFTQVDSSTTRKTGGTGLGLPISRRLVEMHGGRVWAESAGIPGEGSTLFVELPVEARITDIIEKQAK